MGKLTNKKSTIDGGFIVIPKRTLMSKEYRQLTSGTKITYQTMLTEFIRDKKRNPENKLKITLGQIKEISGLGRSTVWRSVKALKEAGFLEVISQGGLERNPSEYKLEGRYLW